MNGLTFLWVVLAATLIVIIVLVDDNYSGRRIDSA
jgi:hypothetical protein